MQHPEYLFAFVIVFFAAFLGIIGICRWAFRINDIVKRLDLIIGHLAENKAGQP